MEYVQLAASWLTVTSACNRERPVLAAPVLAATVNGRLRPAPLVGDVNVIHGAWLVAVHVQPAVVVSAIGRAGATAAPTDCFVGVME
jgi:hypothetical protein